MDRRSLASLPPPAPHHHRPSSAAAPASPAAPSAGSGDAEDMEAATVHDAAAADNDDGDDTNGEIPLTMAASVLLAELPRDATAALASAGGFAAEKVVVRFKAVGAAPSLSQELCKISATRKFEEVVRYLRRKLRCRDTDSVFLYVNSVFAPSLDEVVGNLHRCFKNAQDQLVVAYAITPAFG